MHMYVYMLNLFFTFLWQIKYLPPSIFLFIIAYRYLFILFIAVHNGVGQYPVKIILGEPVEE